MNDVNVVTLTGKVDRVKHFGADGGKKEAAFGTLRMQGESANGKEFQSFVDVKAWGAAARWLAEADGKHVLVTGRMDGRKDNEGVWRTFVTVNSLRATGFGEAHDDGDSDAAPKVAPDPLDDVPF